MASAPMSPRTAIQPPTGAMPSASPNSQWLSQVNRLVNE